MILGITGTRGELERVQVAQFSSRIRHPSVRVVHHGDCVGADELAHLVATRAGKTIFVHPPTDPTWRAFCEGAYYVLDPKPYLERNHDIVDECEQLLAAVGGPERLRSGTWATIRYARQVGKPITLVWPSGQVTRENST